MRADILARHRDACFRSDRDPFSPCSFSFLPFLPLMRAPMNRVFLQSFLPGTQPGKFIPGAAQSIMATLISFIYDAALLSSAGPSDLRDSCTRDSHRIILIMHEKMRKASHACEIVEHSAIVYVRALCRTIMRVQRGNVENCIPG